MIERTEAVKLIDEVQAASAAHNWSLLDKLLELIRRAFKAGAASRDAEVARLKTVPMKYRRMEFNAQLQKENDQLREQVAMLREAFQTFIDEHEECSDADDWLAMMCSCEAYHVAKEALTATEPK